MKVFTNCVLVKRTLAKPRTYVERLQLNNTCDKDLVTHECLNKKDQGDVRVSHSQIQTELKEEEKPLARDTFMRLCVRALSVDERILKRK